MPQLVERMQHFVFPLSAANLNPVEGIALKVDLDAPFLLRGIVVWNLGVPAFAGTDGQLALRFARPDGRLIQRQLTSSNLLAPGNQYNTTGLSPNKALAAPIRPGVLYPAGSVIQMDVMGLNTGIASPAGVIVVFIGTNLYRQGTIWAPGYPAKWKALPYLDQLTVLSLMPPGSFPSLNNAFTAQADSDFVWQAGAYSDFALSGFFATLLITSEAGGMRFTAVTAGAAGNAITIAIVAGGGASPTIGVVGDAITFTQNLANNGTAADFLALLLASPAASALVTGSSVVNAAMPLQAATNLAGGSAGGSIAQLVDIGVIVRDPSYKAYSNGYVPAALLFNFLGAENPGWLYPEIYIPRLAQIYFDFNLLT